MIVDDFSICAHRIDRQSDLTRDFFISIKINMNTHDRTIRLIQTTAHAPSISGLVAVRKKFLGTLHGFARILDVGPETLPLKNLWMIQLLIP